MKKIFRFAAATILALAAIACSESGTTEQNPGPGNGQETADPFHITATFDDDTLDSRVAVDDPGSVAIKFTWEVGDVIHVVNSAANADAKAYAFTAVKVENEGLTATFESPADYPAGETPAMAMWYGKSWTGTQYNPAQIGGATAFATADKLMDNYWLYAKFDAQNNKLSFKPLLSILRFDLTLPASETTINSLRIQTQNGTPALPIDPRFDITSETPVLNSASAHNFFSDELNIPLVNNRAVVYLCVGPMTQAEGETLEIIVNKTQYITQTLRNIAGGKVAPITKPGKTKVWENAIYSGGIGTSALPYLASNETNLRALAAFVNAGGTHTGKYYALENDITLATSVDDRFMPIGIGRVDSGTPFKGNFDGKNHTISSAGGDIYIKDPGDSASGGGIFGTSIGPISNLTVNSNLNFGYLEGTVAGYVGGVVGYINDAPATNCHHIGGITVYSTRPSATIVGGVVGQMFGKENITKCTQSGGTIGATHATAVFIIGGICGNLNYNSGVTGIKGTPEIHQCTITNTTLATFYNTSPMIGAIAGQISSPGVNVYTCNKFSGVTVKVNNVSKSVLMIGSGTSAGSDSH